MTSSLRPLLKKQIREMGAFLYQSGKSGKRRSKISVILYSLLMIYALVAMGFVFFLMAQALCEPLNSAGMGWLYFALMGTVATVLGVVGSVFTTYSGIYQAKDNELLFSMPIPPSKILFVRIVGIYIMSFVFEAMAMVPTLIVYFMEGAPSVMAVILGILTLFILPFFALAISCVLGWLVALLAAHFNGRGRTFATVALSLGFIAGYYYIYSQAYSYLQLILTNSEKIGGTMKMVLYPMYQMGLGAEGKTVPFIVFTAIILAIFALVYCLLSRSFLQIATSKKGAAKVQYKEKAMAAGSKSSALLRKERLRFTGSAVYMLNCGLGTVIMLAGAVAVIVKADWIQDFMGQMEILMPQFTQRMPLIVAAVVGFAAAMNDITAPSVSLEGKSLWIVQSMPVSPWQVLKAKLKLHMYMTAIPVVILAFCIEYVIRPDRISAIAILVFAVLFVLLCGAMGLAINLKMPNLDWTNETVAVKQSVGVIIALFGSWAVLLTLGGIYYAVESFMSPEMYLVCATVFVGVVAALLLGWLKTRGAKILQNL